MTDDKCRTSHVATSTNVTSSDNNDNCNHFDDDDTSATVVMKQKLMSCDEVYLYKIPPLKGSGGHRAEDWDLAKPLQTCSLLVERRDDCLYVDFLDKIQKDPITEQPKVFASSCINLSSQSNNTNVLSYVEQVVDSSRYYTIKIMSGTRTAMIGFGFRERDDSIDFKEAIQFYQNSINRQKQVQILSSPANDNNNTNGSHQEIIESKLAARYVVPKLQEGQKMHIKIKKKTDNGSTNTDTSSIASRSKTNKTGAGAGLFLLKKPPSSSSSSDQIQQEGSAIIPAPLSPNVDTTSNAGIPTTLPLQVPFKDSESGTIQQNLSMTLNALHFNGQNFDTQQQQSGVLNSQEPAYDDEEWSDFQ